MMNGNYGRAWMGGGWMMMLGVLVCIAIIGAVVWLVIRSLNSQQATPISSIPQQHAHQMNGQEYQSLSQESGEMYQEGEKRYSYPQSDSTHSIKNDH